MIEQGDAATQGQETRTYHTGYQIRLSHDLITDGTQLNTEKCWENRQREEVGSERGHMRRELQNKKRNI